MIETKAPRKRAPRLLVGAPHPPWISPEPTKAEVYALKALFRYEANAGQQKTALDYICQITGGTQLEFRPEGERASAFASGKRYVWLEMVKLHVLTGDKVQLLK